MIDSDEYTDQAVLRQLLDNLLQLHNDVQQQTRAWLQRNPRFAVTDPYTASAINLVQYLTLRQHDLRDLQDQLACLGLSSLGRGESGIADNLRQVIKLLSYALGKTPSKMAADIVPVSGEHGRNMLRVNSEKLFGPRPSTRAVYIMVTLPDTAAADYALVRSLVENGMNCARINCAHGDRQTWLAMIEQVHRASLETGKDCCIAMDLAGQKIRTGNIEAGPAVFHLKIRHNMFGKALEPAYMQIVRTDDIRPFGSSDYFQIGLDEQIRSELAAGDHLYFIDLRGKRRHLEIIRRDHHGVILACCDQSAYLSDNTRFQWAPHGKAAHSSRRTEIGITAFQTRPARIRLHINDTLLLTGPDVPGKPAIIDASGNVIAPAQIGLTHDSIVAYLKAGTAVWFDDGKIGATVESISEQGALLRITHARSKGTSLRSDKGVNFPDTELDLPALTARDRQDLDFICQHADIVAYSFVQDRQGMLQLQDELSKRSAEAMPIIAKIETARAVRNLPQIILSTIGRQPLGIMIARGDLATELGSVRMAEIQEEILSLCESAHVPVIWATQVLETLAKEGINSRPEITDAAMSVRAEVVMLNKGPYILETLMVLDEILRRMEAHQRKKGTRLRALHQWPLENL